MTEINGVMVPFVPIGGVDELKKTGKTFLEESQNAAFKDVFQEELDKLKFSAHAKSRLTSREIQLNDAEMTRLESAVKKAEAKGAGDSLILLDDKAFIVNIPNKTVITVVGRENLESSVITAIDSAVLA
jgi:flagellar operon protein